MRAYSEACERNKVPILALLRDYFSTPGLILEIGSGTGQHAVYFAEQLPHLTWQPSDVSANLAGIEQWRQAANLANLKPALALDVTRQPWPLAQADGVFSANTAHIMSWAMVEACIAGVGMILRPDGYFCLYGPFSYRGQFTSASNAQFDASLRSRDAAMGIRAFEDVDAQAQKAGMSLVADHAMPANNQLLVWRKNAASKSV